MPPKNTIQRSQLKIAQYPMIIPATARPRPCSSGLSRILDRARCPQMTPAIPVITTGVQQNPQMASKLRTNDQIANGSVGAVPGAIAVTGPGGFGVMGPGLVCIGAGGCCPPLTPGTVESCTHPDAPSYQARSVRLNVPAASWRFISSSEKGPIRCPFRAM